MPDYRLWVFSGAGNVDFDWTDVTPKGYKQMMDLLNKAKKLGGDCTIRANNGSHTIKGPITGWKVKKV